MPLFKGRSPTFDNISIGDEEPLSCEQALRRPWIGIFDGNLTHSELFRARVIPQTACATTCGAGLPTILVQSHLAIGCRHHISLR
jgi:hypothetical protein